MGVNNIEGRVTGFITYTQDVDLSDNEVADCVYVGDADADTKNLIVVGPNGDDMTFDNIGQGFQPIACKQIKSTSTVDLTKVKLCKVARY